MMSSGAGNPFGPMETGRPDTPKYETDPYNVPAYDQSGVRKAVQEAVMRRSGSNREQALAGLSKAGVQGADVSRAMLDNASNTESQMQNADAQLAQQDFENRARLMESQNSEKRAEYNSALQQFMQEQAARGQTVGAASSVLLPFLNAGTKLGGAYLGSKISGSGGGGAATGGGS